LVLASCTNQNGTQDDRNQSILSDSTTSLLVQEWTKRIIKYPNDVEARIGRGKDLIEEKKYELAILDFEEAVQLSPTPERYILWAEACLAAGKTKKALEVYKENVENHPRNEKALLELGKFYLFVQKYEDALNYLNTVVELDESHVEARFYQGIIFKEMGDTSAALKKFDKVTLIDFNNYNAWMQLGGLKSDLKDASGLDDFNKAIFLEPDLDAPYYAKGFLYQRLGKNDSAAMYYQKTIERNIRHYFAYYNMGYLLFQQEKWDLAIQHFNSALKFAPELAKAHFMLGLTNEAKGEVETAKQAYNTCLEYDSDFEKAKVRLKALENT
jgi:tetratricopeptide (TPR) repeat protein